jgi:hypothetical protein
MLALITHPLIQARREVVADQGLRGNLFRCIELSKV